MKTLAESASNDDTMSAIKDHGKNLEICPNPNHNPNATTSPSLHLKRNPPPPSQKPPLKRSHKNDDHRRGIDGTGDCVQRSPPLKRSHKADDHRKGIHITGDCVQQPRPLKAFHTEEHRRSSDEIVRSVVVRFLAQGGMFSQIASPELFMTIENDERVTAVEKAAIKEAGGITAVETALRSLEKDNLVLLREAVMIDRPLLLVLKTDRIKLLFEAYPPPAGGGWADEVAAKGGAKLSLDNDDDYDVEDYMKYLESSNDNPIIIQPLNERLSRPKHRMETTKVHLRRILAPHTEVNLGDCPFLDTCRYMETCKYVHYELDPTPDDPTQ